MIASTLQTHSPERAVYNSKTITNKKLQIQPPDKKTKKEKGKEKNWHGEITVMSLDDSLFEVSCRMWPGFIRQLHLLQDSNLSSIYEKFLSLTAYPLTWLHSQSRSWRLKECSYFVRVNKYPDDAKIRSELSSSCAQEWGVDAAQRVHLPILQ